MYKPKVLIVDDNTEFCNRLFSCFCDAGCFTLLPYATSGEAALEAFEKEIPDIAVIDLIMPVMDGLELLGKIKERIPNGGNTLFFANSSVMDNSLMALAEQMGYTFIFSKPIGVKYIVYRITEIARILHPEYDLPALSAAGDPAHPLQSPEQSEMVARYVRTVGIPAHLLGYKYLKPAINYYINHYSSQINVTTQVYPAIAKEFGVSPESVERNIRHAIEYAWKYGNIENQHRIFGYTVNDYKGKPTNKEFIALIATKVISKLDKNR